MTDTDGCYSLSWITRPPAVQVRSSMAAGLLEQSSPTAGLRSKAALVQRNAALAVERD